MRFRSLFVSTLAMLVAVESFAEPMDEFVGLFLSTHCLECHAGDDPEANLSLTPVAKGQVDFASDANLDTWQNILEQLTLGSMPPADQTQPDSASAGRVTDWVRSERQTDG